MEPIAPAEEKLLSNLNYRFQDQALFRQAVTHKSYVNENQPPSASQAWADNERLEFLGDAVLDLVISDLLMEKYPGVREGELSKMRAGLVSEPSLAMVARKLHLGDCLQIGRGEERNGGREKDSLLSNALEAVLAAVYLDSKSACGMDEAFKVVRRLFASRLEGLDESAGQVDYKTNLQELAQKQYKNTVTYQVLREEGPDHDKRYLVGVYLKDELWGKGEGKTKKQAEQAAAREALMHQQPSSVQRTPPKNRWSGQKKT
ncbi:MAG: ribonuclease III [Deltaproteobacteria bacterium]|nr:ribonuclease III [Deltaproteobacteria bacterium]